MDKHFIIRNTAVFSLILLVGFFLQIGQNQKDEPEVPAAPSNWAITPNVSTNHQLLVEQLEELHCERTTLWNKYSEEDHALFLRNEFLHEHPDEEISFFEFELEKSY